MTLQDGYGILREVAAFGGHSGRGGRVERRTAGLTGPRSFVYIHIRLTVPRDPPPEVYRDVGDALQTLFPSLQGEQIRKGVTKHTHSDA